MIKAILALSFGKPAGISPNWLIAGMALNLSGGAHPIVADRSVPLISSLLTNFIGKEAEIHVSTLNLIHEFVDLFLKKGWDEVVIVSEPLYMKRCYRDLTRVLEEKGYACTISLYKEYPAGDKRWFDQNSTQWWIRSCRLFRLRETLIRALPFWLYKIIS